MRTILHLILFIVLWFQAQSQTTLEIYIINPHNTLLEYKLYDLSGKLILFASSSDSFIDLSDRLIAAKSLYIIHLSTAEGFTMSQKVIYWINFS